MGTVDPFEQSLSREVSVQTEEKPQGVLEVLNRAGQVLQRIPYHGGSIRVGRAYDNDVIVDDPYVCPHHLVLEPEEQGLMAKDKDSVNGIYAKGHRKPKQEILMGDREVIQVGHSLLRYRSDHAEVASTLVDIAGKGVLGLFSRLWVAIPLLLLALAGIILGRLLDSIEELSIGGLIDMLVFPVIGLLIWSGFWALLNRLIAHRANFPTHLAIAAAGLIGLFVVSQGVPLLCFAMGWDNWVAWIQLSGQILVAGLTFYAHLRYAVRGRPWVQGMTASLMAVLLMGSSMLSMILDRNRFSSMPLLNPLLKPPVFKVKEGSSTADFFNNTQSLKQRLDQETED